MKQNFIRYSKMALWLVVIGFFMPISCDLNGYDIGKTLVQGKSPVVSDFYSGVAFFVVFLCAAISILLGIINNIKRQDDSLKTTWTLLLLTIASVVFIYYRLFRNISDGLQYGAKMIFVGLIISTILLLIASFSDDEGDTPANVEEKESG